MSITLSYQLTQDDYYEFYYYTSWKAAWNKKKRLSYFIQSFFVGLIIITAGVYAFERKNLTSIISSVWIFFAIYIILLLIMMKDGYRRAARKIYEDPKNANLFLTNEISFNEGGILSKNKVFDGNTSWGAIANSVNTSKHYFLYFSELSAFIIPKRVFKTIQEKESFEKMLAQYLPLQAELAKIG